MKEWIIVTAAVLIFGIAAIQKISDVTIMITDGMIDRMMGEAEFNDFDAKFISVE